MIKHILTLSALLVIAHPATAKQPTSPMQSPPLPHVIDGDSINWNGQDIRLHGIDAPEFLQTCTQAGTPEPVPVGRMARDYLVTLIDNKPVQCRYKSRDSKYGRPVMTCTNYQGRDLGRAMVEAGWAWAYVYYSLDYLDDERIAAKYKVGVHAMSCEYPWDWRRSHGNGGRPTPPLK